MILINGQNILTIFSSSSLVLKFNKSLAYWIHKHNFDVNDPNDWSVSFQLSQMIITIQSVNSFATMPGKSEIKYFMSDWKLSRHCKSQAIAHNTMIAKIGCIHNDKEISKIIMKLHRLGTENIIRHTRAHSYIRAQWENSKANGRVHHKFHPMFTLHIDWRHRNQAHRKSFFISVSYIQSYHLSSVGLHKRIFLLSHTHIFKLFSFPFYSFSTFISYKVSVHCW